MQLINGKALSETIQEELREQVDKILEKGINSIDNIDKIILGS